MIGIAVIHRILVTKRDVARCGNTTSRKVVSELYDYLSAYKIEKSYKTKSDYLTIKRWVVDAVNKQNKAGFSKNGNTYQNQLEAARKAFKPQEY